MSKEDKEKQIVDNFIQLYGEQAKEYAKQKAIDLFIKENIIGGDYNEWRRIQASNWYYS